MPSVDLLPLLYRAGRIRCHSLSLAERQRITEVRLQLFERSEGKCELRRSPKCWDSISWQSFHAAHIVSKGRGGTFTLANLRAACPECHGWEHNGGKPCPPKNRGAL